MVERKSDWNYPDGSSYIKDCYYPEEVYDYDYDEEESDMEDWEKEYEEFCEDEEEEE